MFDSHGDPAWVPLMLALCTALLVILGVLISLRRAVRSERGQGGQHRRRQQRRPDYGPQSTSESTPDFSTTGSGVVGNVVPRNLTWVFFRCRVTVFDAVVSEGILKALHKWGWPIQNGDIGATVEQVDQTFRRRSRPPVQDEHFPNDSEPMLVNLLVEILRTATAAQPEGRCNLIILYTEAASPIVNWLVASEDPKFNSVLIGLHLLPETETDSAPWTRFIVLKLN